MHNVVKIPLLNIKIEERGKNDPISKLHRALVQLGRSTLKVL